MTDAIVVAIISGVLSTLTSVTGAILVFISSNKKLKVEQAASREATIAKQSEKIDQIKSELTSAMEANKNTYISELNDVHNTITELKSDSKHFQDIMELKLEHMTKEFTDMKVEVREHNNFAKRMPVVEEQIKGINDKINDLEQK